MRVTAGALALVLAVGGCSGSTTVDAGATSADLAVSSVVTGTATSVLLDPGDQPTSTEGSMNPSETSVSSETTVVDGAVVVDGGACAPVELPSGATTAPALADLDGDGEADTSYMVQTVSGWRLVVELGGGGAGSGGAIVAPLTGTNDFDQPQVLGGADLDGDGLPELGVLLGTGAYVGLVGFVRVRDCAIVQLAFEDSAPAIFASGASAGGGEALLCNGDGTIERFFFSLLPGAGDDDQPEYEAGYQPFVIEGDVITALPGDGAGLSLDEVTELDLFDCLGLELQL